MVRKTGIVVVLSLLMWSLSAQETVSADAGGASARVLAVNLFGQAVDLQMGTPAVFSLSALLSGSPSQLLSVPADQAMGLYFKGSQDSQWRYYQDETGQEAKLSFSAGSITVIRIGREGRIDLVAMPAPENAAFAASYLVFMNGTAASIETMDVVDAGLGAVAGARDVPPEACTLLAPIPAGEYGTRLTRGGVMETRMQPDESGRDALVLTTLEPGQAYLFMAADGASVWRLGELPAP